MFMVLDVCESHAHLAEIKIHFLFFFLRKTINSSPAVAQKELYLPYKEILHVNRL